jgi:hypothetical protein
MILALDFDCTIACYVFPFSQVEVVGSKGTKATDSIKKFVAAGATIVLWTNRVGPLLWWAEKFCKDRGVHFAKEWWWFARKIYYDKLVDDRAEGCPTLIGPNGKPCVDWDILEPKILEELRQWQSMLSGY